VLTLDVLEEKGRLWHELLDALLVVWSFEVLSHPLGMLEGLLAERFIIWPGDDCF